MSQGGDFLQVGGMLAALNPHHLSSLAVIGPVGLGSHDLIHLMKHSTYTVTYSSLDSVLYLSMSFLLFAQVSSSGLSGSTSASADMQYLGGTPCQSMLFMYDPLWSMCPNLRCL